MLVDLRGKSVLVAGGGRVAARKLTELLHCGADVTVVAPSPIAAVSRLGRAIRLEQRAFQPGDVAGRYLVFACTDDSAINLEISESCRAANILCNVADASESGSFHVPGVLRHGDVTVTVSTGGSAPGLTRHLKRVLSDALGGETAVLAALLAEFRTRLRSRAGADAVQLLESLPYRHWLARIKDGDKAGVLTEMEDLLSEADRLVINDRTDSPAIVHPVVLAGAGPGHPQLLTVLAAEALRRAEVIVHDRLIPEEILHIAPESCLLIPAGKRGHFESARQEDIEAELIRYALEGRRVVRLKGGDPFIFGRGWEEILALEARGLPWTVIPGVSSATAAPAWAGIPLTHRGLARSFAVMSGMAYAETNTEIPRADTVVLLMGLQRLAEIVPAFLSQGWSPETPVAAIQNGTRPDQRVCRSNLLDIAADTARLGFDSPTLLVVGAVAGLVPA